MHTKCISTCEPPTTAYRRIIYLQTWQHLQATCGNVWFVPERSHKTSARQFLPWFVRVCLPMGFSFGKSHPQWPSQCPVSTSGTELIARRVGLGEQREAWELPSAQSCCCFLGCCKTCMAKPGCLWCLRGYVTGGPSKEACKAAVRRTVFYRLWALGTE